MTLTLTFINNWCEKPVSDKTELSLLLTVATKIIYHFMNDDRECLSLVFAFDRLHIISSSAVGRSSLIAWWCLMPSARSPVSRTHVDPDPPLSPNLSMFVRCHTSFLSFLINSSCLPLFLIGFLFTCSIHILQRLIRKISSYSYQHSQRLKKKARFDNVIGNSF